MCVSSNNHAFIGVCTSSLLKSSEHSSMQLYVKYLKSVYLNTNTPVYDKEQTQIRFKVKYFINIALVEKEFASNTGDNNETLMDRLHGNIDAILKKKTKLQIGSVGKCEDGSKARSVLIEGAPGVGKTTFASELCKQWAKGDILQEWQAVIILKLRDRRMRIVSELDHIFYHPDPKIRQTVMEMINQNGEGMLLLLDGYDELSESQKDVNSVFQWLIRREVLSSATVVVTSRPLATSILPDKFIQSIDQHIEVLGFTEENIAEYIQSVCGDKPELAEHFRMYLSSHPFLSSLMYNPLQCAIVTDLYCSYWERGDKGFAPKTITELYTCLVHTLLLRYLTHHPVHEKKRWRIKDLSDLPGDVKQQLDAVANLAAEGIKNRQYVFDIEDDNVPSETLGLMVREEEVTAGIGASTSYTFLHLTLQEYLAALQLSWRCSSAELFSEVVIDSDCFSLYLFLQNYGRRESISSSDSHFPVHLFIAGITQLSNASSALFATGRNILKKGKKNNEFEIQRESEKHAGISFLHLLYETQSIPLIRSSLFTFNEDLFISTGHFALDWFVIGYCISVSNCTWRLYKFPCKYIEKLLMGLKAGSIDGKGEGKIVFLSITNETFDVICLVLRLLHPYAENSLTEINLDLCGNQKASKQTFSVYLEILALYPHIEELVITNNLATKNSSYELDEVYSTSTWSRPILDSQHAIRPTKSSWFYYLFPRVSLFHPVCGNNSFRYKLHTLTITRCNLITSVEQTDSVICHLLQSQLQCFELIECNISAPNISFPFINLFQLKWADSTAFMHGSCDVISYFIPQMRFCVQELTSICISVIGPASYSNSLEIIVPFFPLLGSLVVLNFSDELISVHLSAVSQFTSQLNNLTKLQLKFCNLDGSLTRYLYSSNCRLTNLSLIDCNLNLTTFDIKLHFLLHTKGDALNSLQISGFLSSVKLALLQVKPCCTQLSELFLNIYVDNSDTVTSAVSLVEDVLSTCPAFVKLSVSIKSDSETHLQQDCTPMVLFDDPFELTDMTTYSIDLEFPHFKSIIEFDGSTITDNKVFLSSTGSGTLKCLSISSSCTLIKLILVQFRPYFTQLSELFLHANDNDYSSTVSLIQDIPSFCPALEKLSVSIESDFKMQQKENAISSDVYTHNRVGIFSGYCSSQMLRPTLRTDTANSDIKFPLPHCIHRFIGSTGNNIQTLSLTDCILNSDVTSSLAHGLQSSHCRLNKLTLTDCTIQFSDHTDISVEMFELRFKTCSEKDTCNLATSPVSNAAKKVFGYIQGLSSDISQLLKFPPFTWLTNLAVEFNKLIRSYDQEIPSIKGNFLCSKMEKLFLRCSCQFEISIPLFIEQNTLCMLAITDCIFSTEAFLSLIIFLWSPNCKLQYLTIKRSTIPKIQISTENSAESPLLPKRNYSLQQLCVYESNLIFLVMFSAVRFDHLTKLKVSKCHDENADKLELIPTSCPALEELHVKTHCLFPVYFPQQFGRQVNCLQILSVEVHAVNTRNICLSLLYFLQSTHCRVYELTICANRYDNNPVISLVPNLQLPDHAIKNDTLQCLNYSGPWSLFKEIMFKKFHSFTQLTACNIVFSICTNEETELDQDHGLLQQMSTFCPKLRTLQIGHTCRIGSAIPLSCPVQFIESFHTLHTLSLTQYDFTAEATQAFIYLLQSSDCKLHDLALLWCVICSSSQSQFITAIANCSTIERVILIYEYNYTSSLTALTDCLKHNKTMNELAIIDYDFGMFFTKFQLQSLLEAVYSSAVQKLWLQEGYKTFVSNNYRHRSSRNVDIIWYEECDRMPDTFSDKWSGTEAIPDYWPWRDEVRYCRHMHAVLYAILHE